MTQSGRQPRKRVADDFDGAWKNMLTERRFAAFVAFFIPDLFTEVDWTREVEFLEQELRAITRKSKRGQRSVDRLVKVWLKDGSERWMLVHVEIQSQQDASFPLRMFQYYYRAIDLFGERAIEALAILGDPAPDWKPQSYTRSSGKTRVAFEFRVIKLADYSDRLEELESSGNPFARFVLAHLKTLATQADYESRLQWKLRIIQGLYDMSVSEEEIGRLYHDFDWLLALPDAHAVRYHETMTQFEEEREMPHLSTAERIGRRIGKKEGREEGRAEGKEELLLHMVRRRCGAISEGLRQQIHALTARQLDEFGLALMDLSSGPEIEAWLSERIPTV